MQLFVELTRQHWCNIPRKTKINFLIFFVKSNFREKKWLTPRLITSVKSGDCVKKKQNLIEAIVEVEINIDIERTRRLKKSLLEFLHWSQSAKKINMASWIHLFNPGVVLNQEFETALQKSSVKKSRTILKSEKTLTKPVGSNLEPFGVFRSVASPKFFLPRKT